MLQFTLQVFNICYFTRGAGAAGRGPFKTFNIWQTQIPKAAHLAPPRVVRPGWLPACRCGKKTKTIQVVTRSKLCTPAKIWSLNWFQIEKTGERSGGAGQDQNA
jgi:hypothetical protein